MLHEWEEDARFLKLGIDGARPRFDESCIPQPFWDFVTTLRDVLTLFWITSDVDDSHVADDLLAKATREMPRVRIKGGRHIGRAFSFETTFVLVRAQTQIED